MILCASQDFANGGNFKASIKINFLRTLNAKLKKKKPHHFLQSEGSSDNAEFSLRVRMSIGI